ncbi:type I toxin-antitoxin system toxin IbsE, partial [Escherichia coli]|nr:type I toxin-antitoxin system toxin IbsE [Escherichia coli]HCB2640949.1 type I toxin-antitoxin system toxin IbsE [Escherichia coli]HCQ3817825.1 type I toxin-antitoxin system toxin IbsE [Escherichia coli]HDX4933750.1 type I toxin-antitoxin system toxin IbsE [Escherichia coli]HEB2128483.1 type I toxin-antitoxin system toxin IbsE [Escherichia coli]
LVIILVVLLLLSFPTY